MAKAHRRSRPLAQPYDRIDLGAGSRARKGKDSRIIVKLNSLVDHRVIEALYEASKAGVPIDLIVRGICSLRPGIPGVSENIRVISIVDRLLEHSRILVFGEGESAQVFLSSADWMPRNFYRRVEVMFPIESPALKKRILREILPAYLSDNVRARALNSDGTYEIKSPAPGEPPFRCQHELMDLPAFPETRQSAQVIGNGLPPEPPPAEPPRKQKKKARAK